MTAPPPSQAEAVAAQPVTKAAVTPTKGVELDIENEAPQQENANSDKTLDTPSDGKRVPRPFLEIETEEDLSPRYNERRIALDLTPLSCKSIDSAVEYHHPNQTIIIFDWDDTLCPSTTCMRTHGLSVLGSPPEGEVRAALEELTKEVRLLVSAARELADQVVVVTNAEEGWVDLSCKAWLPGLQETIAVCEVASARSTYEPQGVTSPAGWKARTFEDVIEKFYSRYQNQSWKNVISIGDAPHEREALSRVSKWAPTRTGKRCRSKSVKFVLRPSIEQLTREIQMLRDSLKEIVWHDDDLDLHFSAESLTDSCPNVGR